MSKEKKYSEEEYLKAINDLSNKMGYVLNVSPVLFQQDNGTFSIKVIVKPQLIQK